MLISAVEQSDSVIHIYILFILFSFMVYHRILILSIVPCAIGTSTTLLFIHPTCTSLHLLIPNSQSFPPQPLLLPSQDMALADSSAWTACPCCYPHGALSPSCRLALKSPAQRDLRVTSLKVPTPANSTHPLRHSPFLYPHYFSSQH